MTTASKHSLRVLFLCTGNSARSQMAEALLNAKGQGRIRAESAGSRPAARVNPLAIETLREWNIDWAGHPPRGLDGLDRERWDFVITVCDRAKESCPIFPGQPVLAHWGMPDPAEVDGDDAKRRVAFRDAFLLLSRRIDLFVALPFEKLERMALEARVRAIGASEGAHA
ncbi:MAG TPA: arsenate reductase ArsC [Gemmatimonadales bacterium]|nr:arsenate reductase ArsC [Gemmatimonadales bacterium]